MQRRRRVVNRLDPESRAQDGLAVGKGPLPGGRQKLMSSLSSSTCARSSERSGEWGAVRRVLSLRGLERLNDVEVEMANGRGRYMGALLQSQRNKGPKAVGLRWRARRIRVLEP